jgi:hypothetical protein
MILKTLTRYEEIMQKDLYDVYMVLLNGDDVWWQGMAIDGGDALSQALDYAKYDYKQEVRSFEICLAEVQQ